MSNPDPPMKTKKSLVSIFLENASLILLIEVMFFVFVLPFFPVTWHNLLSNVLFSFIFFTAIFTLDTKRTAMIYIALVAFITEWITDWYTLPLLNYISLLTNILFFQYIVIRMIIQIAKSKTADAGTIFESINGYLMMGLMFTTWIGVAMFYDPTAFNFPTSDPNGRDFAYFTFVTMTTLGYGDIAPQLPFARAISILISTAGQIYIAVIIAMLVGKYAGQASANGK
jgi:hypothetical protein